MSRKFESAGKGLQRSLMENKPWRSREPRSPSKKVETLRAKSLSAKQARGVRGGGVNAASKQLSFSKYSFKY